MAKVFGLTGGIAAGKSKVSSYLRREGVKIVDADVLAREVVAPGTEGLAAVVAEFGEDILHETNFLADATGHRTLNRSKLGSIIFKDEEKRKTLEGIILPQVWARADQEIASADGLVCFDAPTLIETGMYKKYRPLVVVIATPEIQIGRTMRRNNISREEAQARLNAQVSNEVRRELADHVLDSTGTLEYLEAQVLKLLDDLSR